MSNNELLQVLSHYGSDERTVEVAPFGNGHINDTFKVTTVSGAAKYVSQRKTL